MTQQKTLKHRVRAHMAKTGERYTTARRQVIAKASPEAPPPAEARPIATEPGPEPALAPVPDSPFRGERSVSDDALIARTGQPWEHWYRLLEAWGAADRPHGEIARFLNVDHGVDGWWSQEVTVRYEMAIGRRRPGQRADGFELSASKTVGVPLERLFAAFVDDEQRSAWLEAPLRVRSSNPTANVATARFDWTGGPERVTAWFSPKGGRTTVAIAHQRLPSAEARDAARAFWRGALASLARYLKADGTTANTTKAGPKPRG